MVTYKLYLQQQQKTTKKILNMKTRIQHVNSPSTSEENFLSQTSDQNTLIRGAALFNTETLSQNLPPPFPVEQSEAPRYS